MIVKQFIVQFESDDSTRWLFSDRDLLAMLWHLNSNAGRAQTEGPEPAVTVWPVATPQTQPEPYPVK
jgi:hypothetical protein